MDHNTVLRKSLTSGIVGDVFTPSSMVEQTVEESYKFKFKFKLKQLIDSALILNQVHHGHMTKPNHRRRSTVTRKLLQSYALMQ